MQGARKRKAKKVLFVRCCCRNRTSKRNASHILIRMIVFPCSIRFHQYSMRICTCKPQTQIREWLRFVPRFRRNIIAATVRHSRLDCSLIQRQRVGREKQRSGHTIGFIALVWLIPIHFNYSIIIILSDDLFLSRSSLSAVRLLVLSSSSSSHC